MQPASGDNFTLSDFDDTFQKLDNAPGVTPVANYAAISALAATLTTSQNNSIYLQADNGSLWQWVKPGAGAGSFRKINTTGLLRSVTQAATVTTTTTDPAAAPSMVSTTFTMPGGRAIGLLFQHHTVANSGSFGYSYVALYINNTFATSSIMSGGAANKNMTHHLTTFFTQGNYSTSPGSTVSAKVVVASTVYGGGTTTASATGQLFIFEV
jgi:hypothetical protein